MLNLGVNVSSKSLCLTAISAVLFSVINLALRVYTRFEDTSFDCLGWLNCNGNFYVTGESLISSVIYYITVVGWPEVINKISYFLLILTVTILALKSLVLHKKNNISYLLPHIILLIMFLHAFIDIWFSDIFISPKIAFLHFELGVIVSVLLWVYLIRIHADCWIVSKKNIYRFNKIKPWVILAIIISMIETALGGWTSVRFASFACKEFPLCQNSWWSVMDLKQGFNLNAPLGLEVLDSPARIAISVVHRLGVLIATVYALGLSIFLLRTPFYELNKVAIIFMWILFIRIIFLAYAGHLEDPVFLTIVHIIGSVSLLLVFAGLIVKMTFIQSDNFN